MIKVDQGMEMKKNQIFFHGLYLNLISLSTGHKILKYFNEFYY